jgi:LysR family glycine cleavage system transcriptional activator
MTSSRLPSLRALQAFNAAARLHSFSGAAKELSITHGAVSRLIGILEGRMGVPLFHRTARGVEPTAAGRRLFSKSEPAFALLEQGLAESVSRPGSDALQVSLSSSLALCWLMPRLPQFAAAHPGIAISVDVNDALIDIVQSKNTVALRFGDGHWDGADSTLLVHEELLAVAAPALLDGLDLPLSPAQLLGLPLLHDDFHDGWSSWARRAGVAIDGALPGLHFNNTALLIDAALQGRAVALVRRLLASDALAAGRLRQASPTTVPLMQGLYFVCRRGERARQPVAAFFHWVRAAMEADGPPIGRPAG